MFRYGKEEIDAAARVLESKNLFKINSGLQEAQHFEEEFKEKLGTKHAILMTSGHAALSSGLIGLGIGPGDQVIVPAYTYIATAMAVVAVGAIPVIAEIDETLTLDPVDVERKITPYTKAIIPVHIQGFPSNMDALCRIAKEHGIAILEDACQSDGGSYKGKRLGTIGDVGAFSFNQFKIISAGEGGALVTDDHGIFSRALIYHDSSAIAYFGNQLEGIDEEQFCGMEYRTNELTAAVLREQLKRMDGILADLRILRDRAINELKDVLHIAPSNDIEGDCGTTVALQFESEEKARKFVENTGFRLPLPIDTGKHVYCNWTAIMNKRGAYNPYMDPFKMERNKDIIPDYKKDMCQKSLDLLSRTVYIPIDLKRSEERFAEILEACKKAATMI